MNTLIIAIIAAVILMFVKPVFSPYSEIIKNKSQDCYNNNVAKRKRRKQDERQKSHDDMYKSLVMEHLDFFFLSMAHRLDIYTRGQGVIDYHGRTYSNSMNPPSEILKNERIWTFFLGKEERWFDKATGNGLNWSIHQKEICDWDGLINGAREMLQWNWKAEHMDIVEEIENIVHLLEDVRAGKDEIGYITRSIRPIWRSE